METNGEKPSYVYGKRRRIRISAGQGRFPRTGKKIFLEFPRTMHNRNPETVESFLYGYAGEPGRDCQSFGTDGFELQKLFTGQGRYLLIEYGEPDGSIRGERRKYHEI